jgi:hypothetical protein
MPRRSRISREIGSMNKRRKQTRRARKSLRLPLGLGPQSPHLRRLLFEPLEDRRLLAGVAVGNNFELVNGNTSSIAALIGSPGADGISLREAILAANATAGADVITFDAALSGRTIALGGTELAITEALMIDARPLAANVTINANELSRIFNITASTGNFTLGGLNLTGGKTTASGDAGDGGGVRSRTSGNLTIDQSTVSGNSIQEIYARGGGIHADGSLTITNSTISANIAAGQQGGGGGVSAGGNVTLDRSSVSGNSTRGGLSAGGGIFANGNVTLTHSTVSGNYTTAWIALGGGIFAAGNVVLTHSTVSGNYTTIEGSGGGGIRAEGAVTLVESTVSGNRTKGLSGLAGGGYAPGGGIYARDGGVMLINSTVSGNSTAEKKSSGGGIYARNAGVTLINSTLSGNYTEGALSHGGGIYALSAVALTQSTITANSALHSTATGGGVFQSDALTNFPISIRDSILANNMAGGVVNDLVKDPQSSLTANYSVLGMALIPTAGTGNVINDNPLLGPLTNNGGPTQTHALLVGSPAINVGDPTITPNPSDFDQRGGPFVRVAGGRIDAGAYERQTLAGLNLVVDSAADEYDGDFSAGHLSLREAVGLANGMFGANTVTFSPAMSGTTISLNGTGIEISEALTIDARPLAENVTIDAHQLSRIFNITATIGDVTLGGLNLTGGKTTGDNFISESTFRGGAVRSVTSGLLTLDQSTLSGNSTTGLYASGGAIFADADVMLTSCIVSDNRTTGHYSGGGGIFTPLNITLTNTAVTGNSTSGQLSNGGGMAAGDRVTLVDSRVIGNNTTADHSPGGGIAAGGDVTLTRSTVSGNSAVGTALGTGFVGGGILSYGVVTLMQSTVSGNRAAALDAGGGGIAAAQGNVLLTQSTVSGNSVTGTEAGGGGIIAAGNVILNQSNVSLNTASGSESSIGGGILSVNNVTLTESTVSGNRATGPDSIGGGIAAPLGNVMLTQSTLSGNSAEIGGGLAGIGVTLILSTVTANHAADMGGGVYQGPFFSANGPVTISGSILAGNTAGDMGPDLVKDADSTLTVNYSLIGTGIVPDAGTGNLATNNPQLAPLANYGGPTQTHAPLPGSPAIDAGNPAIAIDPAQFDQRGAPFQRVVNGDGVGSARIDVGAHELQTVTGLSLIVDSPADVYDGDFSAGQLSLREAVSLANGMPGANTITFATAMSGATINLSGTEIEISEALTIDARPLVANVTINAHELSRILNITPITGDFTLGGLTLVGGTTTSDGQAGEGGAIHSFSTGHLTLQRCTVSGSSTLGDFASGGAIFANGDLSLLFSTLNDNSTAGDSAFGGGLYAAGDVTLTHTIVSHNRTQGATAAGGGIFTVGDATLLWGAIDGNSTAGASAVGGGIAASGDVSLTYSSVTANSTAGFAADGGGIAANGDVSLNASSVSGNTTVGLSADGGGILSFYGAITLGRSTISDNDAKGGGGGMSAQAGVTAADSTISANRAFDANGGGIRSFGPVTLARSTLSGNSAAGLANDGGGIWTDDAVTLIESTVTLNTANGFGGVGGGVLQAGTDANHPLVVSGSIVAGNNAFLGDDIVKDTQSMLTVNYSLIGTSVTPTAGVGNVATDNPQLAPLANNGGLTPNVTWTHALLSGSPAIDAGDPSVAYNPAEFDQRGAPFVRVVDGDNSGAARIDIGAFERQTTPSANFDGDADVDGFDFLAWQFGFGAAGAAATHANGDADYDHDVDATDLAAWTASFGGPVVTAESALALARAASTSLAAIDAAFALDQLLAEAPPRRPFRPRLRLAH